MAGSAHGQEADVITYQGFYDYIQQYVDRNTIVGADASMNYFGSLLLDVPSPGGFIVAGSRTARRGPVDPEPLTTGSTACDICHP
ncbi:hypothetical protein [Streptomyces sp. NPDC002685]|uniref:hypothetical protein n=1 Tax=Streptomyces sp. NPDC002685 TaxID=3154540 RepID=UPI00332115F0